MHVDSMYEGQRDMLYNQTFNLDQVAFAAEGIKDAQQTVCMSALKSANKELKGMMKTVKIEDVDNLQDEMMDLMDISNEIQESLGRSYNVPDDIDEEELLGVCNAELDALEVDMGTEMDADGVPSYLQPDKDHDVEAELNLPSAPIGHATIPVGRSNVQCHVFTASSFVEGLYQTKRTFVFLEEIKLRMNLVYLLCLMHLFATSMGAAGQKEIAQNLI
ncbi:Vacuolar protein sorting-associated protein 60.2 [Vitis vinifera]|uniref:Vacuolar protein sorting-associated protein 60.2 n=1 Tax=Vitis vinifera TaxID=29760 RepID=A0A438C6S8_VITVI|nr:Vacuolar protein sorting-associated protein 60.2 [Vitis vinifera]